MTNTDQSDAIWIHRQAGPKQRTSSLDYGSPTTSPSISSSFQSRFMRSMSVNSEGASTQDSSPPYSPIDNAPGGSSYKSKPLNIPGNMDARALGGRSRTSSFSSGYGPSYGHEVDAELEKDPYLIHSPLSTSAPGLFRRSNSISVGVLEHSNAKYASPGGYERGYDYKYERQNSLGSGRLGPIDEISKMHHFGDSIKRSMGALFSVPKMMPPKTASALGGGTNGGGVDQNRKKQGQMQDRVVSMLCESAIR